MLPSLSQTTLSIQVAPWLAGVHPEGSAIDRRVEAAREPGYWALFKEPSMSLPDPILNFRVKQPIKDALHLYAGRTGKDPGPLMREWLIERLVQEAALELYRSVGLIELLRRLAQPSPAFAFPDDSADLAHGGGQTEASNVLPAEACANAVSQAGRHENCVLHGKTGRARH